MRLVQCSLLAVTLFLVACGTDAPSVEADLHVQPEVEEDMAVSCLGQVCQAAAECVQKGPCISATSCLDGCCSYTYVAEGTACDLPCATGGTCSAGGECVDTQNVVCEELDGNPCTAPSCDAKTGACGEEQPVKDGTVPMESHCWTGLVCTVGELDDGAAQPSALQLDCQEQNDAVKPLGCIDQVVCVDSEPECVVMLKGEGTQCWSGGGGQDEVCPGHSCNAQGDCVDDNLFAVECGEEAWPAECEAVCRQCTTLTCYWIDDPANPGAAKKVKYCKPEAEVAVDCNDGNDCTQGDICALASQTEGLRGKETLGECVPGEGKTKEECLEEMDMPAMPCLKAGITCDPEEGCALDEEEADAWCYPPESVCFSKPDTYCAHQDFENDGKWNPETGCHIDIPAEDGCDDGNPCTADLCLDSGLCSHEPTNEGVQCVGGGNLCLGKCFSGVCTETATEICNGQDDDCDDLVDEDPNLCNPGWTCQNGQCVEDCVPINGGWSDWSCGVCSAQCGGGTVTCTRSCNNPPPSCGGQVCAGSPSQVDPCNTQPCVNYLPTGTTVYSVGQQIVTGEVPPGHFSIQFKLWGGGGAGGFPGHGGGGAHVAGTLAVQPGDEVEIRVAGGGDAQCSGGGASYVFRNGQAVMVAGGGGGAGSDGSQNSQNLPPTIGAGGGGGALGQSGQAGTDTTYLNTNSGGGKGGSQSAGGAGGISNNQSQYSTCTLNGEAGLAHTGGRNGQGQCQWGGAALYEKGGHSPGGNGTGGGGGAGYYGGGSGACMWTYSGGGGGGGSSWVAVGQLSNTSSQAGNYQAAGGTGVAGYQGDAGRGGSAGDWSGWPAVKIDPDDGHDGLVIMVL